MKALSPERLRDDLVWHVHRGAELREFALGAARLLHRAVPFDGVCMVTLDPATGLPTGAIVENGLPQSDGARMAEIEVVGGDFNTFAALARSERTAASLSEATGGDLARSQRHRELKQPHGWGDELRTALVDGSAAWGGLTLQRGDDQPDFTPAESALLASMSRHLAEGLRRAVLLTPALADSRAGDRPPGFALLASDNSVVSADAAAESWIAELPDGEASSPPPAVVGVAARAREIAAGEAPPGSVARVRARTASGEWLLVRGSTLGEGDDEQTAVIIEPARRLELAPLVADAYELTNRERAVTELVARGQSTDDIAARLHISPWTVQDHLKAIFEKIGAGNRGELVSRVFFDGAGPRLDHPEPREQSDSAPGDIG